MSRYRKVDPKIWNDFHFRKLSKPKPNAQTLFFFLITGPHSIPFPGLYPVGVLGIAEKLEWPVATTKRLLKELEKAKEHSTPMITIDWENNLIFAPSAFKYNSPDNPNQIKGWAASWHEVVECELKDAAAYELYKYLSDPSKGFKESFVEGFIEGFGEGFIEPLPEQLQKPLPKQLGKPGTGTRTVTGTVPPQTPPGEPPGELFKSGSGEAKNQEHDQVSEVFNFWNSLKHTVHHKEFKKDFRSCIHARLKAKPTPYTVQEIKDAMGNYNGAIDKGSWDGHPWTYRKWKINEFLLRGLDKFLGGEEQRIQVDINQVATEIQGKMRRISTILTDGGNIRELGLSKEALDVIASPGFKISHICSRDDQVYVRILSVCKNVLGQGGGS